MLPAVLDDDQFINAYLQRPISTRQQFLAMYSSWANAITTNPHLMFVPIDDHMVHRGDGVFEALKFVDKKIYQLKAHLDRLKQSAQYIELNIPWTTQDISHYILATCRAANCQNGLIRLFVSRGPGDFTPNPYSTLGSQLYIVVTELVPPATAKILSGCSLITSQIPVKNGQFAKIKSCNYLPNVLMKKEAVDQKVDFSIGVDSNGYLTEGPTENLIFVTADKKLVVPRFDFILRGTTLMRVMELANQLVELGKLKAVVQENMSVQQAYACEEIMVVGTTVDVLAIVKYDERSIGCGKPGPICQALNTLLQQDIAEAADNTFIA